MKRYDAAVIGGGLIGCFAARELCRYELSVLLLEKSEDVCTCLSKANTAIVYPGYDHKPGTLKSGLTLRANDDFQRLCNELKVPFHRCGSLMVSCGLSSRRVLEKKLESGQQVGVPGLRLISGDEAREMEPTLSGLVQSALYAPTAGTVDPWALCYAAFENARENGADFLPGAELLSLEREAGGYILKTTAGEIYASAIVNCAGLSADRVHELLYEPRVRIVPDASDYLILERGSTELSHIIQQETEHEGKGISAVPTTGGSVLVASPERDREGELSAVNPAGLEHMRALMKEVLPGLSKGNVIRSFAAARPRLMGVVYKDGKYIPDGRSIGSFAIENPEPGFLSFIGIKTPGLTCSQQLGTLAAEKISSALGAKKRPDFKPERKSAVRPRDMDINTRRKLAESNPDYGEIVCMCEDISLGEVREAIARGAVTVDGVKRRCGAMLGVCQGGRCETSIARILARELKIPVNEVTKAGGGSFLMGDRHG